jgi:hypothetical protein
VLDRRHRCQFILRLRSWASRAWRRA